MNRRISIKWVRLTSLLIVPGLFAGALALGQVSASLSGIVQDSTGAGIPHATVTAIDQETGMTRTATTDDSGNYQVLSLPVGQYKIQAAATGFKLTVREGINLVVGQEAAVNLTLEIGGTNEEVTVNADAPVINISTASTSGLVGEVAVKELPLNGRSFDNLITLNTGAANVTANKGGGAGGQVGNLFSVSGQRYFENLFLLNGVEYPGPSLIHSIPGGVSGQLLGIDAVREFNVASETYGAEYGKRTGGQVSIVTQSGANRIHGSALEFLRNSVLDARNYFDHPIGLRIPPFERNQFGGALGGPIRKDKTFIFGNYEGFRQRLGVSDVSVVPDDNARLGFLPNAQGVETPVPGLDPAILPYANAYWPAPTHGAQNFGGGIAVNYSNPLNRIREDFGTVRVDHALSANNQIGVSYTIDDGVNVDPLANPNFAQTIELRTQILSIQDTHSFSSKLINSATLGYSRAAFGFTNSALIDFPSNLFFVPGLLGRITIGGTVTNGENSITLGGGSLTPLSQTFRNVFTYADQIQIIKGRQEITAGIWISPLQSNEDNHKSGGGVASFASLETFLQDVTTNYSVAYSYTPHAWRQLEGAWFVQDTIRLFPHLTARLGVRHEFTGGFTDAHGLASNFVFDSNGVLETTPITGKNPFSENNSRWLFGPRAGLAWDVFGNGKTAVHAGFGTYYDLVDELSSDMDNLAPFNAVATYENTPFLPLIPLNPANVPPPCGPGVPTPCTTDAPGGGQTNIQYPTLEEWSLSVEQELAPKTALTISYLGSHGYHQWASSNPNSLQTATCGDTAGCVSGGVGTTTGIVPPGAQYIPVGKRPNPYLVSGQEFVSNSYSNYNGLSAELVRQLGAGLQFKVAYTYSRNLDNATGYAPGDNSNNGADYENPFDPQADYGPSAQNMTHKFTVSGTYDLPFGQNRFWLKDLKGVAGKFVSGWQTNWIFAADSGFPFTVLVGSNRSGNGDSQAPDRPSYNPNFHGSRVTGNPAQWFNPNAFILPTAGTYGNVGRDTLVGPDLQELTLSFLKTTSINERFSLQFRAEGFNILNRPNFFAPPLNVFTGTAVSPSAGFIASTTTTSRQLQFGLKLVF